MDEEEENKKCFRVLELYSGIGGMHFSMKETGLPFEVIQAFEINPLVLQTYAHNFPEKPASARNIESLSPEEINKLQIDIILMSPPCQPFCRTGRKLGIQDKRSSSLSHLLNILPQIHFKYLLLENVKGFEDSDARDELINTMEKCKMKWQEFLLTPTIIDVPNSRLRYYLIAKKKELDWCFPVSNELLTSIPFWEYKEASPYHANVNKHTVQWEAYRKTNNCNSSLPGQPLPLDKWCIGDIIDKNVVDVDITEYLVSEALIEKYGTCMDIVTTDSTSSNCFTKGYGTYLKGTGSYIATVTGSQEHVPTGANSECDLNSENTIVTQLKMSKLRYFTPREVSRLLCYPETFSFPSELTNRQKYKALGNSINVYIVSILISLLIKN